jgi:type IV secretion system protein VirD4
MSAERDGPSGFELLFLAATGLFLSLVAVVWAGAELAALLGGSHLPTSAAGVVNAAAGLLHHLGDPRAAWSPGASRELPGPVLYWATTALVAFGAAAVVVLGVRLVGRRRVGSVLRKPLGVDARARFARPRDLAPLAVTGPTPGRFPLGTAGRIRLATEMPPPRGRRRRGRMGDRGAVALIGPARSGKTTAAVSGILSWDGPAVLSSVKADLLTETLAWRSRLGQVKVYDPNATTGHSSAAWSPLRSARTTHGAQRAARALCEAAPRSDDVRGGLSYWLAQAEILLSGLLHIAAASGADMERVCEWIMTQDRPRDGAPGDIRARLDKLLQSPDQTAAAAAARAGVAVESIWVMEEETRSSVYGTAQTVVWPWADPGVAQSARGNSVSLDWLLSGSNTVYLCAPIEDQERLAPAFGGLLNDLIRQAYLRVAATGSPIDPPLLLVIDEAGNTPIRALPQYASTLAGLGVVMVTIWQSIAQIELAFGPSADTILTNHLSKLFYTGLSDASSFKYLEAILGDVEVETLARHESQDRDPALQRSTSREPLVPPHAARQMVPGDALLIHGTLPPAHIRTLAWWEDKRLSERASNSATNR